MPHPWEFNEEGPEPEEERRTLLREGEEKARRVFSEFIDFAFSGNILEIAFGLMSVSPSRAWGCGPLTLVSAA